MGAQPVGTCGSSSTPRLTPEVSGAILRVRSVRIAPSITSIELCAGAGGQALGLEAVGFEHLALVEQDPDACRTLRTNRPGWNVIEGDIRDFDARPFAGASLVAAGVPCPPFSKAGRQLGSADERDLFPEALRVIDEVRPAAALLENVRGLLDPIFGDYRRVLTAELESMGYVVHWKLLQAADFGVPQLRPRTLIVALKPDAAREFRWPAPSRTQAPSVGEALFEQMISCGWQGADPWREIARTIAPTLVGGSKKHGGPDLGPTRAKRAWASLGVDAHGLADAPPARRFTGMPRLTVEMTATLQGFPRPHEWWFTGSKTAAYRQVGNAFPPPVARAVGNEIKRALEMRNVALAAA